ncbi:MULTISPECIES: TetR/AcrR family transcriptional regulator [unclassified Paenibacillus]|uniref:TetR/AcrR family transcriptional regulator n=1 Tax=unclassified Paenibacillus TaxID=185978 RepID=UPI0017883138|nr:MULTISPECIES: TetR/AcrR family transcriptional regulator [unclassified Paenibacillus]QOT12269.1 TetR/AcrR family transcriptional regulator [Paenibacillus sp. JNUCC-32]WFB55621.1 TetR/AcrR family transcriptional regulator [Paenibacillus sp. BR1-192]
MNIFERSVVKLLTMHYDNPYNGINSDEGSLKVIKKREITSSHIVQAAYELFAEHGIERTSLGLISKKVGITKSSIYYHFATKEELISRTFDYIFRDHYFAAYFNAESVNKDNFVETIIRGGLNMLPSDDEEYRSTLRVLSEFTMLAERDEQFRAPLLKVQQDFINGFCDLLSKGSDLGLVEPTKIEVSAKILALLIDNLSRCKMMKMDLEYQMIWEETVNRIIIRENT